MQKTKLVAVSLVIVSLITGNFNGFLSSADKAQAAFTPGGQVSPVNPTTGFPFAYRDQNGLTLDLMEAADAFSISAPVEAGNVFSQQIGFGAEGFWWSASSTMDTPTGKAKLVLGLESAFGGESAVDGQQSSFGRVRFQIDGLTPNQSYVIKHPYGNVTEVADSLGSIFATSDIGCFAVAGAVSCDPNSPLGNPSPQFNFAAALSSGIGPFLTWNTFNIDPLQTDAQLKNADPAYANRQYVGNPGVLHEVVGSPINQNIFRIEGTDIGGAGVDFIETNLFSVSGRLAVAAAPILDVIPNKTVQVGNPISFIANATDSNMDPITYSITNETVVGNSTSAIINPTTGVFSWTPDTAGIATFTVSATDGTTTVTTPVTITVTADVSAPATITVTPDVASVAAGATRQFTATAFDASGAQIVPTPVITWTSSPNATIDATGLVTAVSIGEATITATNIVSGSATITVTPSIGGGLTAIMPVDPVSKFPQWYKDRNGLTLELMKANDVFGISAPVVGTGTFSEAIGFGAEGFWSSADATMTTTGDKPAVLVQAVEAAFSGGEVAVDGQQSAFGRVRIRVDITQPGTYTVTYPYGQKTYTIAAGDIGAGYEINDTNDIGCFAIEGVSSCDPDNALGSPQAAFNFNAVGLSEIGPFLTWDTFDPAVVTDAALSNPANPTRKYVGDARTPHAIKGSPTGNNFFRIESATPGVDLDPAAGTQNFIQTNLFNVSGMLDTIIVPPTTPAAPNVTNNDIDNTVTGMATGMEYSLDNGATYTAYDPAIFPATFAGDQTLLVRIAAVAGVSTVSADTTLIFTTNPAQTLTSMTIAPATMPNFFIGTPRQLIVNALDQNGVAMTTIPAVMWTSSDPLIASVSATGLVTAKTEGAFTITATATSVPTVVATIQSSTIAPAAINTVKVTPTVISVATGITAQLSGIPVDQAGAPVIPTPAISSWQSSDSTIATVNNKGQVKGLKTGTVTITATSGSMTGTATVNVVARNAAQALNSIIVTPGNLKVRAAKAQKFTATAVDQNGIKMKNKPAIEWSSSNPAVGTIDAAGIFSALSAGSSIIKATNTASGITGETLVTVNTNPGAGYVLSEIIEDPENITINNQDQQQFTATEIDQEGIATGEELAGAAWDSSNNAVGTVDGNGLFTAKSPGTTDISVTGEGVTQTTSITVVMDLEVAESDAKNAVEVAEATPTQGNVDTAKTLVNVLPDGDVKTTLQDRISAVQKDIDDAAKIEADKAAAKIVSDKISALPAILSLTDETNVKDARTAHDALTAEQKLLVTNLDALTAAETQMATLKAAAQDDQASADIVIAKIDALPTTITLTDAPTVKSARTALTALTQAQLALVTNEAVLTAAEAQIATLQTAEEKAAADKLAADKAIADQTEQARVEQEKRDEKRREEKRREEKKREEKKHDEKVKAEKKKKAAKKLAKKKVAQFQAFTTPQHKAAAQRVAAIKKTNPARFAAMLKVYKQYNTVGGKLNAPRPNAATQTILNMMRSYDGYSIYQKHAAKLKK